MRITRFGWTLGLSLLLAGVGASTSADEGMWLFNDPPRELLKERYGFDITDSWLEHLQLSSVRFNSGGSGSFVSEEGLIMSNHHVGADALQKLSAPGQDLLKTGFLARTLAEEKRALDLELNVLVGIEDVTARVNSAVKAGLSDEEAFRARRAVIAEIEKDSADNTGLRSDVITLYQGGQYHLYRFKRYTDVRLVFAPEQQIAFFGGDPDNFEFPRYDLDVCFFRAYENGQPARTRHYLKWSEQGTAEGDLVFVSGHPGSTGRMLTVAELAYERDIYLPGALGWLYRMEVLLNTWSARSEENARRTKDELFGVQNSRKALQGVQGGLLDPRVFGGKAAEETRLREAIRTRPDLEDALGAWDRIDAAQGIIRNLGTRYHLLESGKAFASDLFGFARALLRAADERSRPNGERLQEYTESSLESLELGLFSAKPVYDDLEGLKLADSLTLLTEEVGLENDLVQQVLAGQSPRDRAAQLIEGTRVKDVGFRRQLYTGGAAALQAANDPMIELARVVDGEARALRKAMEAQGEAKEQAHAQIAKARFVLQETRSYPDATFTLRLAFGTVRGYDEGGARIAPYTYYSGLYERAAEHANLAPYDLPKRWLDRRSRLNPLTPFNFVSTADIIGGNSGSPVVDRQGELVGLIFDGNLHSLVWDYVYSDKLGRAISVDARGILEALRGVYRARRLVQELTTGRQAG